MTEYKPAIPPIVRTVVYAVGLVVGFLAVLITGVAAVWWPDYTVQVIATAGAVTAATSFLAGSLGVAYRPTGHETAYVEDWRVEDDLPPRP